MLNTAGRHITGGGTVIIERHPPQWFDDLVPTSVERNGIHYTIGAIDRDGPLLTTTIEYQVGPERWTHRFTARRLSDDELAATLHDAGFGNIRWLTADHSWLTVATA